MQNYINSLLILISTNDEGARREEAVFTFLSVLFHSFPRDCPLRILRTICCLTFGSGDSEISKITIDDLCNLKETFRNEVSMNMDDNKYLVNIGENALSQCSTM